MSWPCKSLSPALRLAVCLLTFAVAIDGSPVSGFEVRVIDLSATSRQTHSRHSYTILGAVKHPACYRFAQEKLQLQTLIEQAGGVLPTAGNKISVLRNGRSEIVLLYAPQMRFELQSGDIIRIEPERQTAVRVISMEQMSLPDTQQSGTSIVRSAQYEQPAHATRGHVVLLGLQPDPVLMPLWTDGLTTESLLVQYLKQDPATAAQTVILSGPYAAGPAGPLYDGMVLQVPARLVNHKTLPRLPEQIDVKASATENTEEQNPQSLPPEIISSPPESPLLAVPNLMTSPESVPATEQNPSPANSMIPGADSGNAERKTRPSQGTELLLIPPQTNTAIEKQEELQLSNTETAAIAQPATNPDSEKIASPSQDNTAGLRSFEEMLAQTMQDFTVDNQATASSQDTSENTSTPVVLAENTPRAEPRQPVHVALAHEVVPAPRDSAQNSPPVSFVGLIAGGIVLLGVGTVVTAAIKNQWAEFRSVSRESAEEIVWSSASQPTTEHIEAEPPVLFEFVEEPAPVEEELAQEIEETPEPSVLILTALPISEERVEFPRDMKFFGQPQLHYTFRIDARHGLPKPHIKLQKADVTRPVQNASAVAPVEDSTTVDSGEKLSESDPAAPLPAIPAAPAGLFATAYALAGKTQKS